MCVEKRLRLQQQSPGLWESKFSNRVYTTFYAFDLLLVLCVFKAFSGLLIISSGRNFSKIGSRLDNGGGGWFCANVGRPMISIHPATSKNTRLCSGADVANSDAISCHDGKLDTHGTTIPEKVAKLP